MKKKNYIKKKVGALFSILAVGSGIFMQSNCAFGEPPSSDDDDFILDDFILDGDPLEDLFIDPLRGPIRNSSNTTPAGQAFRANLLVMLYDKSIPIINDRLPSSVVITILKPILEKLNLPRISRIEKKQRDLSNLYNRLASNQAKVDAILEKVFEINEWKKKKNLTTKELKHIMKKRDFDLDSILGTGDTTSSESDDDSSSE